MLEAGEELPSTRSLSEELGLNPMTISKAYSRLEMEGLVEKRPGLCLVVKQLDTHDIDTRRLTQFRQSARSVAAVAKQLGLAKATAMEVFAEILDGANGEKERA
jgi:GntR family transcriptional regulator